MTRRFTWLAWIAASFTYLLIVLGAVVRITGSGMGCGEHWPLCRGQLLPPLDLPTLIEYGHRLAAGAVSVLVLMVAAYAWWLRRDRGAWRGQPVNAPVPGYYAPSTGPTVAAYGALGLAALQVALGAMTVKLDLPPWTVILHLGTAMLLLATLLVATKGPRATRPTSTGLGVLALAFVTLLFGGLTANLGAAGACHGFPLCNGQFVPAGGYLQEIHWTHRLLAYTLFGCSLWWASRTRSRGAWSVLALVTLQVAVAAAMVLLALPRLLQAAHVALGAAVWADLVLAVL
ncbi:MAG TPA: COX15/CtaA family protein [Gemmatimonadales bacterium]|nr:COX15/CtaA family protein [Gemmatimonadales bacterium]